MILKPIQELVRVPADLDRDQSLHFDPKCIGIHPGVEAQQDAINRAVEKRCQELWPAWFSNAVNQATALQMNQLTTRVISGFKKMFTR